MIDFKKIPVPMGTNYIKVNCEYLPEIIPQVEAINNFTKRGSGDETMPSEQREKYYKNEQVYRYLFGFSDPGSYDYEWDMLTAAGEEYIKNILQPYVDSIDKVFLYSESQKRQDWIISVGCMADGIIYEFSIDFYDQMEWCNNTLFSVLESIPSDFIKYGMIFDLDTKEARGKNWFIQKDDNYDIITPVKKLENINDYNLTIIDELLKQLSIITNINCKSIYDKNYKELQLGIARFNHARITVQQAQELLSNTSLLMRNITVQKPYDMIWNHNDEAWEDSVEFKQMLQPILNRLTQIANMPAYYSIKEIKKHGKKVTKKNKRIEKYYSWCN